MHILEVCMLISLLALATLSFTACTPTSTTTPTYTPVPTLSPNTTSTPSPTETPPQEIEATEFMGKKLTPISQQRNNALAGTQFIDRETYVLVVDGLVDRPLSLSYADLLAYPQVSKVV